jgi:hypothetical protein
LTSAMRSLAGQPDFCASMGANSTQRISSYTPKEWSAGVARMVQAAGGTHV